MSNIIKFSINGDTNADQVTEKVKKSVSTLEKNMEGVQARFKNFGKDLFLSFAAPMVLLNSAMNAISSAIEKNRQAVQDAKAVAEGGGNRYMREGTVGSAQEAARRRQDALDRKNAKLAAEALAEEQGKEGGFLGIGDEANKATFQFMKESTGVFDFARRAGKSFLMNAGWSDFSKDEEFQKVLESRSAARVAADPEMIAKKNAEAAVAKQKEAAESQIQAQKEVDRMPTTFKGPDGFSNVVGVGANPVIEAMAAQLDEAKKTNDLLSQLVTSGGGRTSSWLDAPAGATSTAAPSRAAALRGR
jgi:hypothetical protein